MTTLPDLHPKLAEIGHRAAAVLDHSTDADARQLADDIQWVLRAVEVTRVKYARLLADSNVVIASLRAAIDEADEAEVAR